MERDRIVDYVAALDDAEWAALVTEARGLDSTTDAKLRAAESKGDYKTSFAIKAAQLRELLNPDQKG